MKQEKSEQTHKFMLKHLKTQKAIKTMNMPHILHCVPFSSSQSMTEQPPEKIYVKCELVIYTECSCILLVNKW